MMNRRPAAVIGGAPFRPTLIMIQVELQIRQRVMNTTIFSPPLMVDWMGVGVQPHATFF